MIEDKNDFLESDSFQIKIKEKLTIFLTENQYPLTVCLSPPNF